MVGFYNSSVSLANTTTPKLTQVDILLDFGSQQISYYINSEHKGTII